MDKHSCSFCDGTSVSARALCERCKHPLTGKIFQTHTRVTEYFFGVVPITKDCLTKLETVCPKCSGITTLMSGILSKEIMEMKLNA